MSQLQVELCVEPLDGLAAAALVSALVEELKVRYDDEGAAGRPLLPADFAPPRGTFLVLRLLGRPVACGGLRTRTDGTGEVKRMYVDPGQRGRGLARLLLAGLERAAAELGFARLVLETGAQQPEAVALYESAGWSRIASFGEWRHSPLSICFGRDLAQRPR